MAKSAARPVNVAGIVGLSMVSIATILSPTGFLGITLPFLALLGFGGLVVCGVSLVSRPRWPGLAGLVIGIACVAGWVWFFWWAYLQARKPADALGISMVQHARMGMSAMGLAEKAEAQRAPTGAPAANVDLSGLGAEYRNDPWGRPYRYTITNTPRGFTFVSDGADGVTGTPDDIDVFTIQYPGTFELPPISKGTPPSPKMT